MPAGRNKIQTKRHDGGKSRVCVYCGGVGARSRNHFHQHAHRRCIPKQRSLSIEEAEKVYREEALLGPAITSKTSMHHLKTTKFSLSRERK
jgi:hypothetical protein